MGLILSTEGSSPELEATLENSRGRTLHFLESGAHVPAFLRLYVTRTLKFLQLSGTSLVVQWSTLPSNAGRVDLMPGGELRSPTPYNQKT